MVQLRDGNRFTTLARWGTLRALPVEEDETASILPAFREYWLLSAPALAFHAGLCRVRVDVRGGDRVAGGADGWAAVEAFQLQPYVTED